MNEAAFSLSRKMDNGDIFTVRGETIGEFKAHYEESLQMWSAMSESGNEHVEQYIGYVVHQMPDSSLRVYFYAGHEKAVYKCVTAYDNHFSELAFDPKGVANKYTGQAPPTKDYAKEAGVFVPYDCKVLVRNNEHYEPDSKKPKTLFVRMLEPAVVKPTAYQKAMEYVPNVTLENKQKVIVKLIESVNNGQMTEEEANDVRKAITEHLDGKY